MLNLLVIDDEQEYCEMVKEYFMSLGCEVTIANTGKEGLEKIKEVNPNIILLDNKLDDALGVNLLSTIKKNNKDTQVFMVSVDGEEVLKRASHGCIADGYLQKPISLKELQNIIIEARSKN